MENSALWVNVGEIIAILLLVGAGLAAVMSIRNSVTAFQESSKKENENFRSAIERSILEDRAAIRSLSEMVITVKTLCDACRINSVENDQKAMEHRLTAIETHYLNVADNIRCIKGTLEKMDEKLDKLAVQGAYTNDRELSK